MEVEPEGTKEQRCHCVHGHQTGWFLCGVPVLYTHHVTSSHPILQPHEQGLTHRT